MQASAAKSSVVGIPRFDGTESGWIVWRVKFVGWLIMNDLTEVVQAEQDKHKARAMIKAESSSSGAAAAAAPGPAAAASSSSDSAASAKAQALKAATALEASNRVYGALMLALDGEALQMVVHITPGDAAAVWAILLKRYERNTMASKHHLRRQLRNSRMSPTQTFDSYLSSIQQLCLRLSQMGADVSEDEKMSAMLEGLPEMYEPLRQSLEVNNADFDNACQHVRDYQEKKKQGQMAAEDRHAEVAMMAGRASGGRSGGGGGGRGGSVKGSSSRGGAPGGHSCGGYSKQRGGEGDGDSGEQCWTCGEEGHFAYDCEVNAHRPKCHACRTVGHVAKDCRRGGGRGKVAMDKAAYARSIEEEEDGTEAAW